MIGISEYAYELGQYVRTVEDIGSFCSKCEIDEMRKIGLDKIPTDNDRFLWDMIVAVYGKIKTKPQCILIAHSLPFIKTNNQDCTLDASVPMFFISGTPCAIMHKAVDIAVKLIGDGVYERVLVIGADKAYSDRERVFFGTIMGDGAVALLLSDTASGHFILSSWASTTVIAPDGENSGSESIAEFRNKNALMMRAAINNCLSSAGLSEVDYYVTHTSNRRFWDGLSVLCGLDRKKFLDGNISATGHLNSHDSFFHYYFWCAQNVIHPRDTVMLVNPGFGGTQGCTIIQR